jgi:iron complex outermembrane recepter protein
MKQITFALFVLFSQTLQAQTAADTTAQKKQSLHEVTVTGIRADKKAPITLTNISHKEIQKKYTAQELPMFLQHYPSITATSDGGHTQGYTYFRLRGIDQTRINMTLEGVPLNEPEDQGAYTSNYPDFLSNVQSMQIQRGVGTSSNGTASYAGSINIDAPTGYNDTSIKIGTNIGSFKSYRTTFEYSSGLRIKHLATYVRVSLNGSDGYKYHSGNHGYSIFSSGGWEKEKKTLRYIFFSGNAHNNMAWYAVSESDIAKDPRTNYNTEREDDNFKQTMGILRYSRYGRHITYNASVYANTLDGRWGLDLLPYGSDSVQEYQLSSKFIGWLNTVKISYNNLTINLGTHINNYRRDHSSLILPALTHNYTNYGIREEASCFIKVTYDIKKTMLFGDVQYRHSTFAYHGDMAMPQLKWSFINPKIGISHFITPRIKTYIFGGLCSREPNRTDIFQGADNPVNYSTIKPETVRNIESGITLSAKHYTLQSNIYYMNFTNEITLLGALGVNGLPLMKNVQSSFRSGLEIDGTYRDITTRLGIIDIMNNSSFAYNRITEASRTFTPLYSPRLISNTFITMRNKKETRSIGANMKVQSSSYINWENTAQAKGFYTLGLHVTQSLGKKFTCGVQLNNITNQKYFTNGYTIGSENYYFVNAPRNFSLNLKYTCKQ